MKKTKRIDNAEKNNKSNKYIYIDYIYIYNKIVIKAVEPAKNIS